MLIHSLIRAKRSVLSEFLWGHNLAKETRLITLSLMRLDKWLWHSWICKSRTAAGDLCKAGRVKVNNGPGKAAKEVRINDLVEIAFAGRTGKFKILKLLNRRGPKGSHEGSYEDLSPEMAIAPEKKKIEQQYKKEARKLKYRYGDGRESKRDKRKKRKAFD